MRETLCCEVCNALILAQGPVALIVAQAPASNRGAGALLQVRLADQASYLR